MADLAFMDEAVWPCRGIAEYAYCPRLFYYMAVEGVFLPSHDTEQGARVHKRVDRPSAAPGPPGAAIEADGEGEGEADPNRPRSIRSLALTSERLCLTATLDLAELSGATAVPVEYRKGRPKRYKGPPPAGDEMLEDPAPPDTPEPWPTDRVQVALQAILLEEAGYEVHEAVIYYAAEKLRLPVSVDEALKGEALGVLDAAREAAQGPRPAPLVNDPKCPRCSLQPICLPDEVNHQRLTGVTVEGQPSHSTRSTPRKMWPPRADGIHVVLQRQGVRVGVRGSSLRVTDRDGAVVRDLPIVNVESLAVLGGVQVSTQALTALAAHQTPVAFVSSAGRLRAMMDPMGPTSAAVRLAQALRFDDTSRRLDLARAVVKAKIANQRTLLMRNHAGPPEQALRDIAWCATSVDRARTLDEVRGYEGNAAAVYFAHFAGMFKGEACKVAGEFDANGRKRRPPPDPINAVLSFAYTMLMNECVVALRLASLEPTLGAFHTTRPGRPSLALDLMEPFRPLIADSVAISAFNRGELGEGHFLRTAAGCALTAAGRKAFFGAYGRRMETVVTHPAFEYQLSYRRMLMLHAKLIAAWLLDDVPTLAFLTTR